MLWAQAGSSASFAWTIDLKAPKLSVSFAAKNAVYGAAAWRGGCGRLGTGVCGTVSAASGVKSVIVWIKQNATGRWWNGRAFSARRAVWNRATVIPDRGKGKGPTRASWVYKLALPRPDGAYTLLAARASDRIGNLDRLRTQKRVTFAINTAMLPVPRIVSGPTNPTAATGADFGFTDVSGTVTFQCSLDGSAWQPCGSPAAYSSLGPGAHVFEVRAVGSRGGASGPAAAGRAVSVSSPAVYQWTISAAGGMPFTISGNAAGALYPGGPAKPISLTLNNPSGVPIYVMSVNVAVETSSLPAGCSAAGYRVTQATFPAAGIAVPADSSISLPAQGATDPSIQMIDTGTNQDACESANLTLSYSGSAHS